MHSLATPATWGLLLGLLGGMLALDLGVFHRRAHAPTFRESLTWSVIWVGVSALFGVWVAMRHGSEAGLQFATGYVLEKALSVDNLFVMLTLLGTFKVPPEQRHRVLFFGVLGALVMRALFIAAGVALVSAFHPVLMVFGVVLIIAAMKMAWPQSSVREVAAEGQVTRWLRRVVPVTDGVVDQFFFRARGRGWSVTPLFLALVAIEVADLVFAVDSIPAVFAVTQDPFIVFSSNALALLGLRSLFFVLAGVVERFHLLKYGLAAVLFFVGVKMVAGGWLPVSPVQSLLVIVAILVSSVVASLMTARVPANPPSSLNNRAP